MSKFSTSLILILLGVLFFALTVLNNQFLSPVRLDLTENQVYSLSTGSKEIVSNIDEPINLYFFFSDKSSKGMTSLRNYANRVESMLQEYSKVADGKINLRIVDPEPFSEAEDQADEFGLTAASIGAMGDSIYLGLAATNSLDDQEVISFFDPQKEKFLEYEISKLIHKLSQPQSVKVTLVSDLPLAGGQNPMTGQFDPAWTFYIQLQQLYQVEQIPNAADALPEDTDVLMLVHPKSLNESLLYAVDQYVMRGGKLIVFVDANNESDPMAMMAGMGAATENHSNLPRLFEAWGLQFNDSQVLLDAELGLDIRTADGGVARHFGFVGIQSQQLDRDDVTTASLEIINGASFGTFSKSQGSKLRWTPLMRSSANSDLMDVASYATLRDPNALAREFNQQNQQRVLAARLHGNATSAYTQANAETDSKFVTSTDQLNVIVVGDTDLLADRFWVQQANFFGETVYTPFANNGDFVTNAVENLGGSNALISIRSRGTFARPFNTVDALKVEAERKFREQEQLLQQQLDETEQQLAQLQSQQGEGAGLVMLPEQQQAIDEFVEKRIEIRKALREVRHQLDKDIESLGNWLKFLNIAVAPILLMLILMLLARLLRTKSKGDEGFEQ
ncbi:GldG family protein [Aliiglaciecola lipolytica]|uniref:ABC-type transport system involved in gliding motility auxiliary component-like protein n=1 Tax=Aliiglaciecola lipolytica E3 TaxID=1127673 RepID=K6YSW9_9ALTE|nr:Gldg family protein [Aliiglaciecola lipolytica]GAC14385.1 ABC-type transport system involved in gliding motility auxiliary component-like protein [Aliiglaciecola lipolytica E3]